MRNLAFVALGSNVGDRREHLAFARRALADLPDSRIVAVSDEEETEPLGGADQPRYLNQMVALETRLGPRDLLHRLHLIEDRRGRLRLERWGPRTLDLDLVLYDDLVVEEPGLVLPHPGLAQRDFWKREVEALRSQLGHLR
ncbi:MAG TPA: 2-amino-4-hydroxy-6-hydroxymethyldihydropteridine diphosphokinase [Gemmatimonadaceae bacterium]|nr:2-amino-4-hydroxy-6-hydroxymethyldihydropteridine diphosphokinase [Gemmatimonadaceae bacterium]